jgi:hypothetical protein
MARQLLTLDEALAMLAVVGLRELRQGTRGIVWPT